MSKEKQAVLKIAGVFISTVIGAGFASGQEIVTFFIRYGRSGLLGLGVAGVLFILYGCGILSCVYKNKLKSYSEFTNQIAGRQAGRVLSWIVTAYMLLSYGVMLAGSGAILQEQFGLSYEAGVLLLSALTFLTFLTGAKGMVSVNSFLAPVLTAGILFISIMGILQPQKTAQANSYLQLVPLSMLSIPQAGNYGKALLSSLLYVSYNMLTAAAVLTTLWPYLVREKMPFRAALAGGGTLAVVSLVLGVATFINYGTIKEIEIPALQLVADKKTLSYLYTFILMGAMYTTAISNGYGFADAIRSVLPVGKVWMSITTVLLGIFVSQLGFSQLVNKGYSLFGYIGLFQLLLLVMHWFPLKRSKHT